MEHLNKSVTIQEIKAIYVFILVVRAGRADSREWGKEAKKEGGREGTGRGKRERSLKQFLMISSIKPQAQMVLQVRFAKCQRTNNPYTRRIIVGDNKKIKPAGKIVNNSTQEEKAISCVNIKDEKLCSFIHSFIPHLFIECPSMLAAVLINVPSTSEHCAAAPVGEVGQRSRADPDCSAAQTLTTQNRDYMFYRLRFKGVGRWREEY